MPISALKVLELNRKLRLQGKPELIENLCDRELKNPEGAGIDIRVGEVYRFSGEAGGFLGVEERSTPDVEKIADINEDRNKLITMNPGDYLLVKTIEKLNVPSEKIFIEEMNSYRHLMPVVFPRRTLQESGIGLLRTKTDPGYCGRLTFGLANIGSREFKFELGARMFNIVFEPVIGEIKRGYEGQWQGGKRVTTEGVEIQK